MLYVLFLKLNVSAKKGLCCGVEFIYCILRLILFMLALILFMYVLCLCIVAAEQYVVGLPINLFPP